MLRVLLLSAILLLPPACAAGEFEPPHAHIFDDVPRDQWAYEAARTVVESDWCSSVVVSCYSDPFARKLLTRYEFAVVTARACMLLAGSAEAKRAVTHSQMSSLRRLVSEFGEELVAMGLDVDAAKQGLIAIRMEYRPEIDAQDYPELAETSEDHWAYDAVKLLYELGILEGYPKQ